jgi:hypothetical protein
MGLKDTVLAWLRQGQSANKKLVKAEKDIVEREYSEAKADLRADSRLGSTGEHFDADESAPG